MTQDNAKISAYIIVKNESNNIEAAIESLAFADEILIVDTGSTDDTMIKAKAFGARVIEIPFEGFGPARQQALAACTHPWILCIDADERVTPELQAEILAKLAEHPEPFIGLAPSENRVMGQWIKHAGWYPNYRLPVFFAKSALRYRDDAVHEGYEADGPKYYFTQPRIHYAYQNMDMLLAKANHYSSLGAEKLAAKGVKPSLWRGLGRASWKFFRHYFIQRGFMDGWLGFIFALNAFNETFYRYIKHYERARLESAQQSRRQTA